MNEYEKAKDKVLDEILDNRTLSDPSSLYDNNIDSLKELNVSDSIIVLLADIDTINKGHKSLHTNIIQDTYQQIKIKDYFKQQALHITAIPELIQQKPDDVLGELFHRDFSRIFEDKRQKYIKKNYLYNTALSQKHLLEGDEEYRENSYVLCCPYPLKNNVQLNIYVEYTYESNTFHVYSQLYHPEINWNPQTMKEGSFENRFHDEYMENFDFSKFKMPQPLTKDNLADCSDMILGEINKHNLDIWTILKVFKNKTNNTDELITNFLKRRLSKNGIEQSFYPMANGKRIKDHTPKNNRALYNFECAFIALLMEDMNGRLPDMECIPKLNKISISTLKDSFIDAEYSLEMVNNTLTLTSDGFFVCKWEIKDNIEFKKDIFDYIEADLKRSLSKQATHNHSVENALKTKLVEFFDNDAVIVEIPQLHTLNMSDILSKTIPVNIKLQSENINLPVSFYEELSANEKLIAIKEKAKISTLLETPAPIKPVKINRI